LPAERLNWPARKGAPIATPIEPSVLHHSRGFQRNTPGTPPLYPARIELVAQLTRLWAEPFASESEALIAFAETYADPVRINGTDVPLSQLVARARMLQRAFRDLQIEPIEQVESGDRFVLAFLQRGRHAGPFETPLGSIAPTGRTFEIRVIDVLTISDGRITAIEVVPDNLSLMMQLGAVRLVD
jgi:ketosteroid isomerase-like protein